MSKPFNYTKSAQNTGSTTSSGQTTTTTGVGVSKSPQMPDRTIHHPPIAMYIIGGSGVLLGIGTNLFQMFTTFIAFWSILNPNGSLVDLGKQPMDFAICAFIALSFQFSLIVLTFRIDTTWKRKNASIATGTKGNAI